MVLFYYNLLKNQTYKVTFLYQVKFNLYLLNKYFKVCENFRKKSINLNSNEKRTFQ